MKTEDMEREIKKITAKTGIGLSISSLNDSIFVIRMYPSPVLMIEIVILPKKKIREPIPFVMKKVAAFFNANTKAAIADVQNDSPVKAI